ncbi:MAG: N-acetyltransferase family protein [Actinomycetota bacterium]|nr:GNAT family N-acetyltransferase [Actinomycetota bacterium]
MSFTIREAGPQDWFSVATLLAELGRPDVANTPDADEHRSYFEQYIRRTDAFVFVAEAAGEVIGVCDLEFKQWLNFLSPMAWIPDLVVTERARSGGVGAALLQRAEEASRERGALWLALESANWRDRAHAFYVREGWADAGKAFMKRLGGAPPSSPPEPAGPVA